MTEDHSLSYASPTPPKHLVLLQEWFSNAVCELDTDKKAQLGQQAPQFLTASSKQNQTERLGIYTSDFWPRCLDSLRDDFPVLSEGYSESAFETMLKDYILAFPPSSYSLIHLGEHLSKYIEQTDTTNRRLFRAQLARFEWLKIESTFAENTPHFAPDQLTDSQRGHLDTVPLLLHPSVRLARFDYAVHTQRPYQKQPTYLVVCRRDFNVSSVEVDSVFLSFLNQFQNPRSISDAVDSMLHSATERDFSTLESSLTYWLNSAVQNGWFKGV